MPFLTGTEGSGILGTIKQNPACTDHLCVKRNILSACKIQHPDRYKHRLQELFLAHIMSPNLSIQQERNSDHAFSHQSVDPSGRG